MNDRSKNSSGHLATKLGESAPTQLQGVGFGQGGSILAGGS